MKVYKIISTIGRWIWQLNKLSYLRRMKIKFNDDGSMVTADSNIQLVTIMRENSYTREKTNQEYMLNYARRAVINNNEDVCAINEDDFITDLLKLKHIEKL